MTAGHRARYSRLVMKALQLTRIGRFAFATVPTILLTTATLGAQTTSTVDVIVSTDIDTRDRLLRSGVFDDLNEPNRRALSSSVTEPGDDRIRWLTFFLIFTDDELSRYAPGGAMGAKFDIFQFAGFPGLQPWGYPIHIVVTNRRTTLVGTVEKEEDKRIAEQRAREAPGVLEVHNALVVSH
jgi:hypothetical protein